MPFDQRWAYRDDLQDKYGQQAEGGLNHNNNCVPATFSNILHAYGYLHTQPQWWVTNEYPLNFLGPTSYAAMIDWMKKNSIGVGADFPNPPDVRVSNPVDTVGAVEAAGVAGYAIAFNGWSDGSGNYQTRATGILHVGAVMQHGSDAQGPFVIVLNPEHNTPQRFGEADFRAITSGADAGWLAIFAKPLPTAPVPIVIPPIVPPVAPPSPPVDPLPPPAAPPTVDPKDDVILHLKALVDQDTFDLIDKTKQISSLQEQVSHLQAELKRLTDVAPGPTTVSPDPWWIGALQWLRRMLGA